MGDQQEHFYQDSTGIAWVHSGPRASCETRDCQAPDTAIRDRAAEAIDETYTCATDFDATVGADAALRVVMPLLETAWATADRTLVERNELKALLEGRKSAHLEAAAEAATAGRELEEVSTVLQQVHDWAQQNKQVEVLGLLASGGTFPEELMTRWGKSSGQRLA